MKRIVLTNLGLLLAIVAVSPNCRAADVQLISSGDFNTGANWSDGLVPSNNGDVHIIQGGLTATLSSPAVVTRLVVSDDTAAGTLNIVSGGDLTSASAGDDFQVARGCCNANGMVDLSGTAILRTAQNSTVGDRDQGTMHVGPQAQVISTAYWRVGNNGPTVDTGLQGNGFLDVEGTFNARAMFIGVNDGTGVVQVRGNGKIILTPQSDNAGFNDIDMDFNHSPIFQPNQSGTIHMIGSTATFTAGDLFSQDPGAPIKNQLWFTADSGGVSPIKLAPNPGGGFATGAVNITNNALRVDLAGFAVAPGQKILLVDGSPNLITGTFTDVNITGANPAHYAVLYDQPTGNIYLQNTVPEPSTALLLGLGAAIAVFITKRRASR
jgi:hypothetical protein